MQGERRPPNLIAIDGPAASGKSTVGRELAHRLGYRFLDTGLMYRAFTLKAVERGVPPEPKACAALLDELDVRLEGEPEARVILDGRDVTSELHSSAIEEQVSAYSRVSAVRSAMRERQRAFAREGRAILAGRDIGEVVLPDADLKLYFEASEAVREARRQGEREPGEAAVGALQERDARDTPNTYRAGDALIIDTTHLSLEEAIQKAWEAVQCVSA